ncbi:hypothetical protein GYMLUDRAFT_252796 [Collybiopsis luxurians FD-317 M1]|uniref:Uncharacterized protein n=1 Tax=Collybiopsis luxurians FD-317 M1 TaxID=944289 RepID=A0A0D0B8Z0_9AGAR|nr:hypothetical protein GYMLUDRAFT_252796 [Collybiopsis luxurians FD-317 M1]
MASELHPNNTAIAKRANWAHTVEPISSAHLQLFRVDPDAYGPSILDSRLDTSGQTVREMGESAWNQTLIFKLARHAEAIVAAADNPQECGLPGQKIEWDNLFKDKIQQILRDIYNARIGHTSRTSSVIKQAQATRAWKFKCRQSIATAEQQCCRENGDAEGEECWGFVLYAVDVLQIDRMSDEEDGEEEGEAVKWVLGLDFCRREFRYLFHRVDSARSTVDQSLGGRKFKRRVETSRKSQRSTPVGIPSAFLSSNSRDANSARDENHDQLEGALLRFVHAVFCNYCLHMQQ